MTRPSRNLTRRILRQNGFTLVEAIVALVLTGILAGIMVLFINRPVRNYVDSAGRADMSDVADLALRRMARELRTALPNSIRVTSNAAGVTWLEFIPTRAGGRYLSDADGASSGTVLSFSSPNATEFSVVGTVPSVSFPPSRQDFIVIYNLGPGFVGADAYAGANIARVTGLNLTDANNPRINFASLTDATNPFATQAINSGSPNSSPENRFQVVGLPVTFRCENNANGTGTLRRSEAAGFNVAQSSPGNATGALLADNVRFCNFNVATAANQQSALVGLNLSLARQIPGAAAGALETISLTHQIHVDNTP